MTDTSLLIVYSAAGAGSLSSVLVPEVVEEITISSRWFSTFQQSHEFEST